MSNYLIESLPVVDNPDLDNRLLLVPRPVPIVLVVMETLDFPNIDPVSKNIKYNKNMETLLHQAQEIEQI
jgi:hypothetical protein